MLSARCSRFLHYFFFISCPTLPQVQATKAFEFCAREAVQIFGGSGIVREGAGLKVERIYREVRGSAIPGGSEEILLDFAIRFAASKADKEAAKALLAGSAKL